jgi:hypothetical protein
LRENSFEYICKEYFNALGIKFVRLARDSILFYGVFFTSTLSRFFRFWYFHPLKRNSRIYSWCKIIYPYDILNTISNSPFPKVLIILS